ncbi:hypothetical protein C4D60_Mb06t22430 [Musa balbisiana]|uniref:NECAP PHear domain-containing protein n=1 Tax=Musa balbisiana TaxID=52838 RepID=A0A4S8ISE5_MUSBA|nr:hypothetical protein C4D60_Mb06t22430 [Musa balbisiana]
MDRPTHPNLPGSEQGGGGGGDDEEAVELVLFHANECYVYLIQFSPIVFLVLFDPVGLSAQIPPRKSAASYRADEWNVNKWAWEGVLKVVSKGKECIIRLEDKTSGELYARAFLREGEPHPVEPVIDSSRTVQRPLSLNQDGRNPVVVQHIKKGGQKVKSACLEQSLNNLSLDGTTKTKEGSICLKPPPPPPAPLSPVKPAERSSFTSEPSTTEDTESHSKVELSPKETSKNIESSAQNVIDDDFGDFQAAG